MADSTFPARRRFSWFGAVTLAALLLSGCGQEQSPGGNPNPAPATGAEPAATAPATAPAAPAADGPQSCNAIHLPKITAIERWDNPKLGAKGLLQRPESIAEDPQTGDLYVSNVNGVPTDKDGNGYTTQLHRQGGKLTVAAAKRFPPAGATMNAPKGTLVVGDRLWVVDIDTVYAFDLRGAEGKLLHTCSIPAGKFGNDLTAAPDGAIYGTDTLGNAVYSVPTTADGPCKILTTQATGANGIVWNAKTGKLVIAGTDFGQAPMGLSTLDPATATVTALSAKFGKLDGLVALPSGALLVSDWDAHAIWWVSADGQTREKVIDGFEGAADFCLLKDGQTLAIPDMPRHEVVIVHFEKALE